LQILRVILAIIHRDAGHRYQGLGSIDPGFVHANAFAANDIQGSRQIEAAVFGVAAGNNDAIKRQGWHISDSKIGKGGGKDEGKAFWAGFHDRFLWFIECRRRQ
jgi:hypothetical protein